MYDLIMLPQAKDFLPAGSSREACIAHNRLRKSVVTALRLHMEGVRADTVTPDDMARAALWAGVKVPGSDETRRLIVTIMRVFEATPVPMSTLIAAAPEVIVPVGKARRFLAAFRRR